jgi:outer membrane protein assembly factor BamB
MPSRPTNGAPVSERRRRARLRRRRNRRLVFVALVVALAAAGAAWADTDVLPSGADDAPQPKPPPRVHRTAAVRRPLPGALLIADRGNDRILLVNQAHRILWRFPTARDLRRGVHLNFNDDSFVAAGGRAIVANEEEAHTVVSIDVMTHRRIHLYGVPGVRGQATGLLNTPDDAYPLPSHEIVVADAYNCRVIWIRNHRIVRQLGRTGVCSHDPPRTFGAVNGDTPLPGGGLLVSEIAGHWIDEIGARGQLLWSVQAPVRYPSDPQLLPRGLVLVADYSRPGQVVIMNRRGHVFWRYRVTSGWGALDHPSLAVVLPNGMIAVNDDYRDRVVVIDPRTRRIVWQYGHVRRPSARRGFLDTPDGLDFVPLDRRGRPLWALVRHPQLRPWAPR